jgi:hypothetical protein
VNRNIIGLIVSGGTGTYQTPTLGGFPALAP